jgi:tetratricopeptide (TPR) repeat protein
MGLVGVVAGVVAMLSVLWLLRDGLRDSDPSRRRWAVIATFTSVYFFSHQLVDFFANAPATFLAFAIPIAVLDASRARHPRVFSERALGVRSRLGGIAVGLGTAAALVVAIAIEIPALIHADAVARANAGDWASARGPADQAASLDPDMPIYRLTSGLAAAHAGDYAAAAEDFRVIAEAGDLPEAWLDLADAYVHLERTDLALGALDRALRLGRQQPLVAAASVQVALQLGDHGRAVAAAASALMHSPGLVADPWWMSKPERSAVLREAEQIISSTDRAIGWQLALYAGRWDEALRVAAALPAPDASIANLVIAAWDGQQEGYETLIDRCLDDPYGPALGWCVAVAIEREAPADVRRLRSIAQAAGVHDLHGRYRLVEDPLLLAVAGNNAILYGIHAYRRFTPWDMLSPGLLHLADD